MEEEQKDQSQLCREKIYKKATTEEIPTSSVKGHNKKVQCKRLENINEQDKSESDEEEEISCRSKNWNSVELYKNIIYTRKLAGLKESKRPNR